MLFRSAVNRFLKFEPESLSLIGLRRTLDLILFGCTLNYDSFKRFANGMTRLEKVLCRKRELLILTTNDPKRPLIANILNRQRSKAASGYFVAYAHSRDEPNSQIVRDHLFDALDGNILRRDSKRSGVLLQRLHNPVTKF